MDYLEEGTFKNVLTKKWILAPLAMYERIDLNWILAFKKQSYPEWVKLYS